MMTVANVVTAAALLLLLLAHVDAWVIPQQLTTTHSALYSSPFSSTYNSRANRNSFPSLYEQSRNNIVLEPSSNNINAFDSYQVGSPRVHRYVRDNGMVEYTMWYHGRSQTMTMAPNNNDNDKDNDNTMLVPLSTGRIGRACSQNGLVWKKDEEGSASEDVKGVSLGLNKESWWGFDTAHVGLGQVLLPISTPSIISEGGVFLMYYMGGSDQDQTPLSEFTSQKSQLLVQGMPMKIGVALSQDGITWGRVEGDDPSGACMVPYNSADPNQGYVSKLKDDDGKTPLDIPEELYCAWPDVIPANDFNDNNKKKKKEEPKFFMYYSTMTKMDKQKCIGCAVSQDGFRWLKRGICLRPTSDDEEDDREDDGGVARCQVLSNANFVNGKWESAPGYTMFYEGVSKTTNTHGIFVATSTDGRNWIKQPNNAIVIPTTSSSQGKEEETTEKEDEKEEEEAWDAGGVGSPHVIRLDDGSLRMYYTGQSKEDKKKTAIGVMTLPPNQDILSSSAWRREQAALLL